MFEANQKLEPVEPEDNLSSPGTLAARFADAAVRMQVKRRYSKLKRSLNYSTISNSIIKAASAHNSEALDEALDDTFEYFLVGDGATILQQMNVVHPAAKMLVELSKAQDIEAGDGKK